MPLQFGKKCQPRNSDALKASMCRRVDGTSGLGFCKPFMMEHVCDWPLSVCSLCAHVISPSMKILSI